MHDGILHLPVHHDVIISSIDVIDKRSGVYVLNNEIIARKYSDKRYPLNNSLRKKPSM